MDEIVAELLKWVHEAPRRSTYIDIREDGFTITMDERDGVRPKFKEKVRCFRICIGWIDFDVALVKMQIRESAAKLKRMTE